MRDGTADETSDVITYSYTLTNTGNAAISTWSWTTTVHRPTRPRCSTAASTPATRTGDNALDVGETWTYSATNTVTQAMLDAGSDIVNIVTADGDDATAETDDATVDVVQSKVPATSRRRFGGRRHGG